MIPLWAIALGTTLLMQTIASFMDQSLPIIAPLLTSSAGFRPERIGNISSLNSIGTVLFLLFGGAILARLGPVRTLQVGSLMAAIGLAIAATGWWPILVIAALVMGVGYGPSPPAGSRILAATAPKQHRTLIFSIKQAGAPAGGALAGLILAPIAARFGWHVALLASMVIGLTAAAAITPLRRRLDIEREPDRDIGVRALFNRLNLMRPVRLLLAHPRIASITVLSVSFAMVQGSLFSFSVTYLAVEKHLSLPSAGFAYACMQSAGVFARIFLGWLADRTGQPAWNLTVQAFVACTLVIGFAWLPDHPPLALASAVAGATGFFAASWNGIYMAEIARLSPSDQVAEVTASCTVFTFLGYLLGPTLFSFLVTLTSNWTIPFFVMAAQLGAMAVTQVLVLARRVRLAN